MIDCESVTNKQTFAGKRMFLTKLEETFSVVLGDKILSWKLLSLKVMSRCETVGYLSCNGNPSSRHNASFYWRIALLDRLKYPMSLTTLKNMCTKFLISRSKYISMATSITCVFLWIPNILKELRNVLYKSVLKAYFFINIGFLKYPMSLTILTKFHDDRLNSLCLKA
jgi:hypothetical protein